ncbi:MAG: hypothetical protein KDK26_13865 [Roseivivax sp.]|nr:hypothetical protein [Roseivivax sp.]
MTIRALLLALPLLLAGWFATLLAVAVLSHQAPAYVVLFPGSDLLSSLPADVAVLSATGFSVTLTAERPGLARALYRQGAWVVLPAGLRGCLPMPRL